jgi:predicted nuclease of predicted toxin-antitoxin system
VPRHERFPVDASSDARIVGHLRHLGHDVTRVGTDHPGNLKDVEVLATAVAEQRILITDDRDFGELVCVRRHPHTGVIYFRLNTTRFVVRASRLDAVLANHSDELDQFLIVTEHDVRVRRLTDASQPHIRRS